MNAGKHVCRYEDCQHSKKKITSSYDGSFLNVFYACVLQFYDVFSFYHKA